MSLTYTDLFCGAGGSSIGLTAAGLELRLAANHWDRAIATHAVNFPAAEHLCADVSNYDMRRLPSTDVLWASPICTEISPAGGRRRRSTQLDLLEETGHVPAAGMERTRATFHDVIRATEVHRYTAVLVENVTEAADWELFDWWVTGMDLLGYTHQFVSVSSAHVGGPGNPHAPQWRDRLYIVFTRLGVPAPDVDPRPVAWCPSCGRDVDAVQSWRNPRRRRIGKYRQQYDYRCPDPGCRHTLIEPYVAPAATAIDWTDLGTRIGDRRRPLAAATLRRIRTGLDLYGPAGMLSPAGGTWNQHPTPLHEPMRTRTTRDTDAVCTPPDPTTAGPTTAGPTTAGPFVTMLRAHAGPTSTAGDPLATLAAGGNHHALTVPAGTVTSVVTGAGTGHAALVVPYRRGRAKTTAEPLHTLGTRDSAALVQPDPDRDLADCRFRMLRPREHLRAQRFPDTYTVTGNQGEQTTQAGNAVSANVAQWLGGQVAAALDSDRPTRSAPREAA